MINQLIEAIKVDDTQKVKELLENGVDVNTLDEEGDTALFWATIVQSPEICELLLPQMFIKTIKHVNKTDNRTALEVAYDYKQDIEELIFLLEEYQVPKFLVYSNTLV